MCFTIMTHAVTYTVSNTNDSGTGSLRQAITDANTVFIGTKNIIFNIPTGDQGYNTSTGIWTITPATPYPYLMSSNIFIDGTTQTASQGNTNADGPEIFISGNGSLDHTFLLVSGNNTIKGISVTGCLFGIQVANNTATNNLITECYLGINSSGITPMPNGYGITISNASANTTVSNCLISGNTDGGIAISESSGNSIRGNKIGTSRTGTASIPNPNGIAINNASNNIIGGTNAADRNILSGNTNSGITINAAASTGNQIIGNYIGTEITGTGSLENGTGIIIVNAGGNFIGGNTIEKRNIISGNIEGGIILNGSGTNDNIISGNYIGVDVSGLNICSNHVGIMLKSNARRNIIGGTTPAERNILSGNTEIGVYIEASDSNRITGNYIGPDATGAGALKIGDTLIQANGIELNVVSKYNIIGGYLPEERNIISGNRVYGMIYYGQTSYNPVIGNYIGTDVTGNISLPNATGICVDAASNHNLIKNNVLSGNISYGIFIVTTGSYYNEFKGNLVGTNAAGTSAVPNDAGLLLGGGARYNIIGGTNPGDRNIFSGNRYDGILIADNTTDFNQITGNYIGTDITGMNALPNPVGIGISTNPASNTFSENVISGNSSMGIILYENADSNIFILNKIGVAADGISDLGNEGAGIAIAQGASYNKIGMPGQGNIIAYNDSCGIVIADNNTKYNSIRENSIHNNNFLGIEIFPPGPNANDVGDTDTGSNDLMNHPVILSAIFDGILHVSGSLDTQNPQNAIVEIFEVTDADPMGYGEGSRFLGSAIPDAAGNWSIQYSDFSEFLITATANDAFGNASEFSQNFTAVVGINDNKNEQKPILGDNFPNPFSEKTIIPFILPINSNACIEIKDINNKTLMIVPVKEKTGVVEIKTKDWAAGVYYYLIKIDGVLYDVKKMLLIKRQ